MISEVEVAKSNKSFCKWCNKNIKKLEIRGVRNVGGFICSKCLNFDKIVKEIREIEKEFKRLNRLTNQEREDILLKGKVMRKLKW